MTLLSYAKATKRFEKGLLIISIRLFIISLFVLSLYFRGNIFLVSYDMHKSEITAVFVVILSFFVQSILDNNTIGS